jgi:Flp pilus assembly pilin Flp
MEKFHRIDGWGFHLNLLRSLWRDETGVQSIEYGLVGALIAIVIVGVLRNVQLAITSTLNIVSSAM